MARAYVVIISVLTFAIACGDNGGDDDGTSDDASINKNHGTNDNPSTSDRPTNWRRLKNNSPTGNIEYRVSREGI